MNARIAVLFNRLGPYHHARLEAMARRRPIVAVEFSSADRTYQWSPVAPSGAFGVHTLLADREAGAAPLRYVRARMTEVLEGVAPAAVAIPGWSAPASLAALEWCVRRRVPAVVMSESQQADAPRRRPAEWAKSRIVRLFSAGLVGGAPHRRYLESLGMAAERVFTGYDVVDNEHFAAGADAARRDDRKRRRELNLPERYFLASSRFVPKKNLSRLLQAYAAYRSSRREQGWKLVLLGDGPLRPELVRERDELGLGEEVLLPGFKQYEELPAYYGLAQAFVHASTVEQWGLVVNEAMAAGLPVLVSSACGCAPDLVREGVNGHVFDALDLAALARCLESIASGEEDLAAMGRASRGIIAGWTPERFAEGLDAAVAAAIGHPAPPAALLDRLVLRGLAHR